MKVSILGTGSVYSRSNCAGILIGEDTLLDIGPGTVKQLIKEKKNLLSIHYILISHLHLDHILDLPVLICNIIAENSKHIIHIYGPKGTKKTLQRLIKPLDPNHDMIKYFNRYFKVHAIRNGYEDKIGANVFRIYRVEHGVIEAYGFNINHILSFTGDAVICKGVRELAANCKYLICDCSRIKAGHTHMGINNINQLAIDNPNITIIPTHYRDETRKALQTSNPHHFTIIDDGYSFEIDDVI